MIEDREYNDSDFDRNLILTKRTEVVAAKVTEFLKATDVIGPYQGNVAAVRRSWARQNRSKILSYIAAYHRSIEWLYEPANRNEAILILRTQLPQLPQQIAEASYAEMLDPVKGFFRKCDIDREGLACVLALRSRYGLPPKQLNDPARYCDRGFANEARMTGRP